MSLEKRVTALEEAIPTGYTTYDSDGKTVIESDLPALEWYVAATKLLTSRGHVAEKAQLTRQLAHSAGPDNGGGYMYQMAAAAAGPAARGKRRTK